ncbi:Nn.00g068380.m01.CDS01 [Neocucurbitaria sp. VM-36]
MPPFHNNKLNAISLDDSDDQSYTPVKKSAKGKKPTPKPKPDTKPAPKEKATTTIMGCLTIKRKQRKAGQVNTPYNGRDNQTTDSGMNGMPVDPIAQYASTNNDTLAHHNDTLRALVGDNTQYAMVGSSGKDLSNSNGLRLQLLGDQKRLHLNGFDIDPRVPTVYPISPPKNAFAAKEHRDLFPEFPRDPYDSYRNVHPNQGTLQEQSVLDNNLAVRDLIGDDGLYDDDNDTYGSNVRLRYAMECAKNAHGLLNGSDEDSSYAVQDSMDVEVKEENDQSDHLVSTTPVAESEYEESDLEDQRARKIPKINKDGAPRKPRQPRPKLLKWDDNDWKNVALGIVWACGENGISIPFDQAAQVVGESCTAGALQQAILKLRLKQIAEGIQIPALKMAWTRKRKHSDTSLSTANARTTQDATQTKTILLKKKPTRWEGNQTLLITLKRAYQEADRMHLDYPHEFNASSNIPTISHANGNAVNRRLPTSLLAEWPDYGRSLRSPPGRVQVGSNSSTSNAHRHHHITGMYLDGSLASPTRSMPPDFDPGCDFLSTDPRMRFRKAVVFDNRSDRDTRTMGPRFIEPGTYMPPSPNFGQSPTNRTLSGPSSVYGMAGNSACGTAPTTPASDPVFSPAFGTPLIGPVHSADDNMPILDGTFNSMYDAYGTRGRTPATPPRSVAADRIIADRLNSSLRQDGAFNPQGNRDNWYHATWNGCETENDNDWTLGAHQMDFNIDSEDDSKAHSGDGLADPFFGDSAHH